MGSLSLDEKVMRDMALGVLDGIISERALLARYNATPGALTSTLRRLMRDQLAEPSPEGRHRKAAARDQRRGG
ncbi:MULTISPECIES: hypothetical protein [Mesorhizobium]|uniref:hypothetical protein n=1 Tax=Mesorhizobium TaxID=68287 RepID=UPI000FEA93C6|nr:MULTISPECIES: hypothetical protein [Mesorhizobium]MCF6121861.1 hypothetical protein [Mesorhizobium ciceri]MCQ8812442.1 hypothetical protein [Mesorhizobium sp. SEMIA396]RWN29126.1 MAG: hypothetical protein EOR97_20860 [Mesorhizobium sp.]